MSTRAKAAAYVAVAIAALLVGSLAPSESWARKMVTGTLHGSGGATGGFRENIADGPNGLTGALSVKAQGLTPGKTFTVSAGGTALGAMKSNRTGRARATFVGHPHGRAQGLATDPRGKVLAVTDPGNTDPNSEDVLEGEVGDPTTPGTVPCCLNTADEQGCSDLLPIECTSAGGAFAQAATCDPDPCPGQGEPGPVPGSVPCCLNTADQQGCTELLPADCTNAGGSVAAGATSCEPGPCPGQPADGETGGD